jgi:hypothetical protein
MKKWLIILIYTFSLQIKAQNSFQWADSGAVWHLAYTAFVGPGYQKMMYESMGGDGDDEAETEDKIIKNISKEVIVSK